jgi:hypothetical protein
MHIGRWQHRPQRLAIYGLQTPVSQAWSVDKGGCKRQASQAWITCRTIVSGPRHLQYLGGNHKFIRAIGGSGDDRGELGRINDALRHYCGIPQGLK